MTSHVDLAVFVNLGHFKNGFTLQHVCVKRHNGWQTNVKLLIFKILKDFLNAPELVWHMCN